MIAYETRPFLKWAGGKSQLLPGLLRHVPPEYGRYYEPFVGGGAFFFALQPRRAVLSDSNPDLIEVYRVVQRDVERLIARLRRRPVSREAYYAARAQDPRRLSPAGRAARFIYLNRTCYNGLYRVNRRGQFNVPFGRYLEPRILDSGRLRAASDALRRARLRAGDFEAILREADRGDLVYLDPPFDPLSPTASFTSYTAGRFDRDEQARLAEACDRLARRGCHVMLSNSNTPLVRDLYRRFRLVELKARRAINRDAAGRGAVTELLILNR